MFDRLSRWKSCLSVDRFPRVCTFYTWLEGVNWKKSRAERFYFPPGKLETWPRDVCFFSGCLSVRVTRLSDFFLVLLFFCFFSPLFAPLTWSRDRAPFLFLHLDITSSSLLAFLRDVFLLHFSSLSALFVLVLNHNLLKMLLEPDIKHSIKGLRTWRPGRFFLSIAMNLAYNIVCSAHSLSFFLFLFKDLNFELSFCLFAQRLLPSV